MRQLFYWQVPVSKFEKTPARVLQGLVLANSHVFTEIYDSDDSQKAVFSLMLL